MTIDFSLGVYAGSLAVAWLAFLLWTWRLRHPAPVLANSGYVLALESAVMDLEDSLLSVKAMRDLQEKTNRFLLYRISYLSQQITWLLSVQSQPIVRGI